MTTVIEDSGLSFSKYLVSATDAKVGYVKLLTYGASGAGKTTLLSTMPDPLLVLLTEKHGEMTIRRVNPKATIMHIEDKTDGRGNVIKAKDILNKTIEDLSSKKTPFVSVALDSLTDLQQIYLWDSKGGKPGAEVSLREWGKLMDQVKHLIMTLRNLNMHVGVICLADELQDNNQRVMYRPALAGKKLPNAIMAHFNLVGFQRKSRDATSTGQAVHESVFAAGDEAHTKSHPALEPIEAPSVRAWVEKIGAYAKEHGEGDMPSTSLPVSTAVAQQREDDAMRKRLAANPRIKELFELLGASDAKIAVTMRKFKEDGKLIETLEKRLVEQQGEEAKKEAEEAKIEAEKAEETKKANEEAKKTEETKKEAEKPAAEDKKTPPPKPGKEGAAQA